MHHTEPDRCTGQGGTSMYAGPWNLLFLPTPHHPEAAGSAEMEAQPTAGQGSVLEAAVSPCQCAGLGAGSWSTHF